ncbi:hypothetical protein ACH4UM_18800 [Streptomyces sp. NPDC020801]|uniref:hypothetical protein n=1 Tax=Streptomyces sp. NPDC020801 TaxID=3365093 RepID=UPI003793A044
MAKSTGPACGNNPNHPLTDGDRQAVDAFRAYLAARAEFGVASHRLNQIQDAARLHREQLIGTSELYAVIEAEPAAVEPPVDQAAVWVDGDPLMEAIAAAAYAHCRTGDGGIVHDDPRNIAAAVAGVARAAVLREAADALGALDPVEAALAGEHAWHDAAALLRRLANKEQSDSPVRCQSCDHEAQYHDSDGRCWFTVERGTPGSNLVCPCAAAHTRDAADEAQQQPATEAPETDRTAAYLSTQCDACRHTLNWHRNDVGCTVTHCVCGRFRPSTEEAQH